MNEAGELSSLLSGALVHYFGWMWVNLGAVPLLLFATLVMQWYSAQPAPSGRDGVALRASGFKLQD